MLNVECRMQNVELRIENCQLSIVNCQLSIVNCQLSIGCQLDVNWTQKRNKAFTLVVVAVANSSKGI